MKTLEDRLANLETRLSEAVSRQAANVDRMNERSDKAAQVLEQARVGEKRQSARIDSVVAKLQEFEQSLKMTESETRELCMRERQAREQSLRSTQQAIVAKQEGELSDLEQKFLLRREREFEAMTESRGNSVDVKQASAAVRPAFGVATSPSRARLEASVSQSSIRVLSPQQRMMSNKHMAPQVVASPPPSRCPVPVQVQAAVPASMPAGWWGGKGGVAR